MTKQPTTVERHSAAFANGEKPASFRHEASLAGLRHRRHAAKNNSASGVQTTDDSLLEVALVNDTFISEPLTHREMQIMKSIIAGQTNKQMARTLCRSQRTIEYHRNRLMRKLNAHNTAELIKHAIAVGIA